MEEESNLTQLWSERTHQVRMSGAVTEDADNKKEDDNKPDKKSSKKKLILKKNPVQFKNVNGSTDEENNEDVCAAQ